MNRDEFIRFLERVTYKPGYRIMVHSIAGGTLGLHGVRVGVNAELPDIRNPSLPVTISISRYIGDEELRYFNEGLAMEWLRRFFADFEQHELQEWLKLDGVAPFNPHKEDAWNAR